MACKIRANNRSRLAKNNHVQQTKHTKAKAQQTVPYVHSISNSFGRCGVPEIVSFRMYTTVSLQWHYTPDREYIVESSIYTFTTTKSI